ncbi:hypothetical protein CALCODRAFT_501101 [Calocera cornea HHB12733]|uniref:D-aminoacyl-tRNA deacylase n=1 Tax=Calocera cornea HHB12733 TaxID=1353952 RepID=A0A165DT74_9BASI|nr:hypothetical protein CALCODRAFT_501101 [Calocera cornea HHB12733]
MRLPLSSPRTDDTRADSDYIVRKILSLKLFDAGSGSGAAADEASHAGSEGGEWGGWMWRRSVLDIQGEILCVSQFTLLASTIKGSKPDFHNAMPPVRSKPFYTAFLRSLRAAYGAGVAAAGAGAARGEDGGERV